MQSTLKKSNLPLRVVLVLMSMSMSMSKSKSMLMMVALLASALLDPKSSLELSKSWRQTKFELFKRNKLRSEIPHLSCRCLGLLKSITLAESKSTTGIFETSLLFMAPLVRCEEFQIIRVERVSKTRLIRLILMYHSLLAARTHRNLTTAAQIKIARICVV